MRSFDRINWPGLPDGQLVLMTVSSISDNEKLQIADFTDTQALVFAKNGCYIGMSRDRGLRFGKPPASLVDGIWLVDEDQKMQEGWGDTKLSSDEVVLGVIR